MPNGISHPYQLDYFCILLLVDMNRSLQYRGRFTDNLKYDRLMIMSSDQQCQLLSLDFIVYKLKVSVRV